MELVYPIFWRLFPESIGLWLAQREYRQSRWDREPRDQAATDGAALPTEETVRIVASQVNEVYLPSDVAALEDGLRRLGFDKPSQFSESSDTDTPRERIIRMRNTGSLWAYQTLRPLSAEHQKNAWSDSPGAVLPKGVTELRPVVNSPVAGATVLTLLFVFDEETARSIEEPFRTHYQGAPRKIRSGVLLESGSNIRERRIDEIREALHRRCERWVTEWLPGVHARRPEAPFPTIELLAFELGDPLAGQTTQHYFAPKCTDDDVLGDPSQRVSHAPRGVGAQGYMEMLGQRQTVDAWVERTALVLRMPSPSQARGERAFRMVWSTRLPDFNRLRNEREGWPRDPRPRDKVLVDWVGWGSTFSVLLALESAQRSHEEHVARTRDRLGRIAANRSGRALRQLGQLSQDLATLSRGARPLFRGLAAARPEDLADGSVAMQPLDAANRLGELIGHLSRNLIERAKKAVAEEKETRETAEHLASLATTGAAITSARINVVLQLISIAIAGVALLASALAIRDQLPSWASQWLLSPVGQQLLP